MITWLIGGLFALLFICIYIIYTEVTQLREVTEQLQAKSIALDLQVKRATRAGRKWGN